MRVGSESASWSLVMILAFAVALSVADVVSAEPTPETIVPLDLLEPAGPPHPLTVAPGEGLHCELRNRIPGRLYRVTWDWTISPSSPRRPAAGALHGQEEIPDVKPPRLKRSGACDTLQTRALDVVGAADESEVPERVKAYRTELAIGACTELRGWTEWPVIQAEGVQVGISFQLYQGDEMRLAVDRLDPVSREPVKTWHFIVRPRPVPEPRWSYSNEEAWIVGEVSGDLAEMIAFAARRPPAPAGGASSRIRAGITKAVPGYVVAIAVGPGPAQSFPLTLVEHVWSPASYGPLASSLLDALGARPLPPSNEATVLDRLADPRSAALERESQRISRELEQRMLDAGLHEQAAMVLGVLGLREAAGTLSDIRHTLCRISAHLALARALRRGARSPEGDVANAVLLTLVGRQRDALALVAEIERAQPTHGRAVLRALRVRNTYDWRVLSEPRRATLIERLAHVRAVNTSIGSSAALEFLDSFEAEPLPDWGLLATVGSSSVEAASRFGPELPGQELEDAASTWRLFHGSEVPRRDLLALILNAAPERLIAADATGHARPRVLGWGLWARFFQRHLGAGAMSAAAAYGNWLGLEQEARETRADAHALLSGLELWPSLALRWFGASSSEDLRGAETLRKDVCARGVGVVRVAPERVSAGSWNLLERLCNHERERHELPAPSRWFATLTPWGTALYDDDDARLMAASAVADQSAAFRALRELAPHDRRIVSLADPGDEASPEATAALYGPLAEYDLTVLRKLAWSHRQDPSAAVPLYEKAVQMDPGGYLPLGSYLADQYRDEEAAAAYEKAIAKARDRVAVSHYALWLVGHYCDMGRLPRAREVAQMAADTGSAPGLEAMGYFAERMGRPAEAEAWYQKVAERYGDRRPLDQFYMRYAHRFPDGRFNTEARSALAALFPAGLERVSLVDFTEPPKPGEGVRVTGRSQRSTRFGLRKDDIVVALNGYRVGNDEQYATLWTFDDGPAATVIVWRDARYVEIKGELRGTRYEPVARPI